MTSDTHTAGGDADTRVSANRRPHPVLDSDSFGARSRDGGSVAPLTVLQYALLHHLAYLPPHKVATWLELAVALRPYDRQPITPKAVQWHVVNLRRRLSQGRFYLPPGGMPWPDGFVVTVRGHGLRLDWSVKMVVRTSPPAPPLRREGGRGKAGKPKASQRQAKGKP